MYNCNWLIYHLKIEISSFKTSNMAATDLLLNLLLPAHFSPSSHATFFPWNSASVCGPRIQASLALTDNPFQPFLLPSPLCVTSCGLLEPLSIRYLTANTLGLKSETPQMPYFLGSRGNHSNQRTEQPPDVNTRNHFKHYNYVCIVPRAKACTYPTKTKSSEASNAIVGGPGVRNLAEA